MEKKVMNLTIADRTYPLHVREGQEQIMEKAAKMLNERIQDYATRFKVQDRQDLMAMAALEICSRYFEVLKSEKSSEDESIVSRLMEIDQFLGQHIQQY